MSPVVVGMTPVCRGIEAVCGEIRDSARIVIRPAERVLNLSREILAGLAAKRQFERVALQVSFRLHLPYLPKRRIWTHSICFERCIGIDRPELIDPAVPDVGNGQRALGCDLLLNSDAILQNR